MDNKSDITLDGTFAIVTVAIGFVGLLFLLIHYLHLDTFRIDVWIEVFRRATFLSWAKFLLYSGLTILTTFLLFRNPYKVILTEQGVQLHKIFTKPQTIKWEDIAKFEVIENKKDKNKIALLIMSEQFSTEVWPSQRLNFQVVEHSSIRAKMYSLTERKMIR